MTTKGIRKYEGIVMRDLLAEHGFKRTDAAKLMQEGIGPHELAQRLRIPATEPGGLTHTHGIKKVVTHVSQMKTPRKTKAQLIDEARKLAMAADDNVRLSAELYRLGNISAAQRLEAGVVAIKADNVLRKLLGMKIYSSEVEANVPKKRGNALSNALRRRYQKP
jgi:hypothetical protein